MTPKTLITTLLLGGMALGGSPALAQSLSLSDIESNASDRTARDALLAERHRQDQFQSAIQTMSGLTRDAMALENPLDENLEVRWGQIDGASSRISLVADSLPDEIPAEERERLTGDADVSLDNFGSEEWVKRRISADVVNHRNAQEVSSVRQLRAVCEDADTAEGNFRGALNEEGLIGGTNKAACFGITENNKERASSIHTQYAMEEQMTGMAKSLSAAFGLSDNNTAVETIKIAVDKAENTESDIVNILANGIRLEGQSASELIRK